MLHDVCQKKIYFKEKDKWTNEIKMKPLEVNMQPTKF